MTDRQAPLNPRYAGPPFFKGGTLVARTLPLRALGKAFGQQKPDHGVQGKPGMAAADLDVLGLFMPV